MENKRKPLPIGFSYRTREAFDEDEMATFRQKFVHFRVNIVNMSQSAVADSIETLLSEHLARTTIGQFEIGGRADLPRSRKILEEWMRMMEEQLKLEEVQPVAKFNLKQEMARRLQKEIQDQKIKCEHQAKKLDNASREFQRLKDETASNAVLKTSTSSAENALNEAPPIKSEPIDEAVPEKQDMDFVLLRVRDLANQRRKRSCKVYVIVDEDGKIVYIGTAWDVAARLLSHRKFCRSKDLLEFLRNQSTMRAYVVYEGFREECLIIEAALIGCRDELELNTFNERLETPSTKRKSDEYETVDADGDIQMVINDLPMNKNDPLHAKFINGLKFLISGGFKSGDLVEIKKKRTTKFVNHPSSNFSSASEHKDAENESPGPSPQVPPKRKRKNYVPSESDEDAPKTPPPKKKRNVSRKPEIKKKKSLNFQRFLAEAESMWIQ